MPRQKQYGTCGPLVIGYAVWLKEKGSFKVLKVNHNDKGFAVLMFLYIDSSNSFHGNILIKRIFLSYDDQNLKNYILHLLRQ